MRVSKSDYEESIKSLRETVKPGDTLTTVLRSVSRSNMSRTLDVFKQEPGDKDWGGRDNNVRTWYLTFHVARVLGLSRPKGGDALRVDGCGMDMGFHVVYELSRHLWPHGFDCIGEGCPSNAHSNGESRRKGKRHHDGGYAIRQRWL